MRHATRVIPIPIMGKRMINAYLLVGRRPVLVDTGTPGNGHRISDAVAAQGIDPADVSLIVLTHGHIDHFGSAAELHRLTGAPIAGHAADLAPYSQGRVLRPYLATGPLGRLFARTTMPYEQAEPFSPHVLVQGAMPLHDYGLDGRVVPTPGHTPGSISVLTGSGDLIAGDLVGTSLLGWSARRPANPPFHDDPLRNLRSLEEALALQPARLYVGHGGPLEPGPVTRWALRERRRLSRRQGKDRSLPEPGGFPVGS